MTALARAESIELVQGTPEWLALRKTKITATDSAAILGVSPWKTALQLYHEKLSNDSPMTPNERMRRGTNLEPIARELFCYRTGHKMIPKVVIKEWAMASLDGINDWNEILEVKCPGEKDHNEALLGKVPAHYYPQLQHQMYVCDAKKAFYFSFDGFEGVTVEVKRDDAYIEKMIEKEKKFYDCLINRIPPEPEESDYKERNDPEWNERASRLISLRKLIKDLERDEQELEKELIALSGELNTKGAGISLCQIQKKGNVDYSKIPELKSVDLDKYRKSSTTHWRISCA